MGTAITDTSRDLDPTVGDYLRNLLVGTSLGSARPPPAAPDGRRGTVPATAVLALLRPGAAPERADGNGVGVTEQLSRVIRYWRGRPAPRIRTPRWLRRNLGVLGRTVGLQSPDLAILQFLLVLAIRRDFFDIAVDHFDRVNPRTEREVVAAAIGEPYRTVCSHLSRDSVLVASGLVGLGTGLENLATAVFLQERVVDLLLADHLSGAAIHSTFAPLAPTGSLELDDYRHMNAAIDALRRILVRGIEECARGVNALLYGPTGSGKTELACALARAIGAQLHQVGVADGDGDSPSAYERLRSLLLANQILRGETQSLLLFDELEDLFEQPVLATLSGAGPFAPRMSKQWFNRMLEDNATPTIWITNCAESIDPAFRRRFTYSVLFRDPDPDLRRRLWQKHTRNYAQIGDSDIQILAERYEASAGLIANAARTAALLARDGGPTRSDLEAVLRPSIELTAGVRSLHRCPDGPDSRFVLGALNADADLELITERLRERPRDTGAGVSLCLYGPPGTGKSAYARHLAQRLGMHAVERTVSDLVSPWVGATEQNIARAFDEAGHADAMLVFDEVDSFLRDRALGERSWEITEVNEFLRHLENFPGVFVCTTNRFDDLDPAAARRFVFKIRFDWLRPEQAVRLFRDSLGPFVESKRGDMRRAERYVSELSQLAPGDFAAVRRRLTALGSRTTPMQLIKELTAELAAKGNPGQLVGFRP